MPTERLLGLEGETSKFLHNVVAFTCLQFSTHIMSGETFISLTHTAMLHKPGPRRVTSEKGRKMSVAKRHCSPFELSLCGCAERGLTGLNAIV